MFLLEYAQFHNRRFAGWIDGGWFATEEAARAAAASRGLLGEGDDFLVSGPYRASEGTDAGATRSLYDF